MFVASFFFVFGVSSYPKSSTKPAYYHPFLRFLTLMDSLYSILFLSFAFAISFKCWKSSMLPLKFLGSNKDVLLFFPVLLKGLNSSLFTFLCFLMAGVSFVKLVCYFCSLTFLLRSLRLVSMIVKWGRLS